MNENLVPKIVAFVEVLIPITKCNIKCHYCYVVQRENRTNHHTSLPSPNVIAEALSVKRFGGNAYISLCGAGETMLTPELEEIVFALLKEGHFVNVTTNGIITKSFERFETLAIEHPELTRRLNFSFSLHHLELERSKSYQRFWDNVRRVKRFGASFVVQINLCDEYEPYLEKIKEDCLNNVGAYPQVAATRDEKDMTKDVRLFTTHSQKEYEAIGKTFNSPLFEFTMRNFMVKRKEFCFAGRLSYVLNLSTGIIKPCYCSFNYQNIYEDISKPIKLFPVGKYCQSPFCMNSSHFISLGTIPEYSGAPTYASLRNRQCSDGSEWYTPEFKEMASQKLYENVDMTLTFNDRIHICYYGIKSYWVKKISAILPKNAVKSIKTIIRK